MSAENTTLYEVKWLNRNNKGVPVVAKTYIMTKVMYTNLYTQAYILSYKHYVHIDAHVKAHKCIHLHSFTSCLSKR